MKLLKQFIQQETVLTAAAVLAVVSAFFVPPDAQYLGLSLIHIFYKFRVVGFSIPHFFPAEKIPKNKKAPGRLVAALRGHPMCVVPWRTRCV